MKYSSNIDNLFCHKHKIKPHLGMFLDLLVCAQSWADQTNIDGEIWYFLSRYKVLKELPNLTEKADTIYRYYRELEKRGFILYKKIDSKDSFRLTKKMKEWGRKANSEKNPRIGKSSESVGKKSENESNSEKNPSKFGKKSEQPRKIIRENSEKNPTYKSTSNKNTSDNNTNNNFLKEENFEKDFLNPNAAIFGKDLKQAFDQWLANDTAWQKSCTDFLEISQSDFLYLCKKFIQAHKNRPEPWSNMRKLGEHIRNWSKYQEQLLAKRHKGKNGSFKTDEKMTYQRFSEEQRKEEKAINKLFAELRKLYESIALERIGFEDGIAQFVEKGEELKNRIDLFDATPDPSWEKQLQTIQGIMENKEDHFRKVEANT